MFEQEKALYDSIQKGNLEEVKELTEQLLANNFSLNQIATTSGTIKFTPLGAAVFYGQIDIAKFLIEKGADINAPCEANAYPIHRAVLGKQKEALKMLLDLGANVEEKADGGATPLMYAGVMSSFENAAIMTSFDIIKILMDCGANAYVVNDGGKSILDIVHTYLEPHSLSAVKVGKALYGDSYYVPPPAISENVVFEDEFDELNTPAGMSGCEYDESDNELE